MTTPDRCPTCGQPRGATHPPAPVSIELRAAVELQRIKQRAAARRLRELRCASRVGAMTRDAA